MTRGKNVYYQKIFGSWDLSLYAVNWCLPLVESPSPSLIWEPCTTRQWLPKKRQCSPSYLSRSTTLCRCSRAAGNGCWWCRKPVMEIGLLRFLLFSCQTTRLLWFINLTVIDALVTGVDQHLKSPRYLRNGWRYQNGWIFRKNPNGLPPPLWNFSENSSVLVPQLVP